MFSNIPTIKKLIIDGFDIMKFPNEVQRKLEQLILRYLPEIDNNSCKKFLESQQFTLKRLFIPGSFNLAYFIMRTLPNLESLTLSINSDNNVDDKFLIRNSQLKRLNILGTSNFIENNVLETILNHYNNIQYLTIISSYESNTLDYKPLIKLKFKNLSHLMLKGIKTFPFLNSITLNIKTLVLANFFYTDGNYDYSQISSESIKNVEKLCLHVRKEKDALIVLPKCPKLTEMNIKIEEWREFTNDCFISSINQILELAPTVECLGIEQLDLILQQMTVTSLLDQISSNQISLKEYRNYESMFTDEWGREHVEYNVIR